MSRNAADLVRLAAQVHSSLRQHGAAWEAWVDGPFAGDLWIDGYVALRRSDPVTVDALTALIVDTLEKEHGCSDIGVSLLPNLLAASDTVVAAAAAVGRDEAWSGLVAAIALVQALGGPPSVVEGPGCVLNDSLILAVSPTYRAIRFAAFNRGLSPRIDLDGPSRFAPECLRFTIGTDQLVNAGGRRGVQEYGLNHDLAHLVLFGDAYIGAVGEVRDNAALLLNAEETVIGLDLALARDLRRTGLPLVHADDFQSFPNLGDRARTPALFDDALRSHEGLIRLQADLKASAQGFLPVEGSLRDRIAARAYDTVRAATWVSLDAQRQHARHWARYAAKLHSVAYRSVVHGMPLDGAQITRLQDLCGREWTEGELPIAAEAPDPARRVVEKARSEVRCIVAGFAERAWEADPARPWEPPGRAGAWLARAKRALHDPGLTAAAAELANEGAGLWPCAKAMA